MLQHRMDIYRSIHKINCGFLWIKQIHYASFSYLLMHDAFLPGDMLFTGKFEKMTLHPRETQLKKTDDFHQRNKCHSSGNN